MPVIVYQTKHQLLVSDMLSIITSVINHFRKLLSKNFKIITKNGTQNMTCSTVKQASTFP